MLLCASVRVDYETKTDVVRVLDDLDLEVGQDPVALMGPSGSGKTSLLRCISGIQAPTAGRITLDGTPIEAGGDPRVSLVFQDHRLIEFLSVAQNLRLAAELRGQDLAADGVADVLEAVGLAGYENRMPASLSGGQAQRVAIARALSARSRLLLADEPTGALDEDNSLLVARLLASVAVDRDVILIVATHDQEVAALMHRTIQLNERQHHPVSRLGRD